MQRAVYVNWYLNDQSIRLLKHRNLVYNIKHKYRQQKASLQHCSHDARKIFEQSVFTLWNTTACNINAEAEFLQHYLHLHIFFTVIPNNGNLYRIHTFRFVFILFVYFFWFSIPVLIHKDLVFRILQHFINN